MSSVGSNTFLFEVFYSQKPLNMRSLGVVDVQDYEVEYFQRAIVSVYLPELAMRPEWLLTDLCLAPNMELDVGF